MFETIAETENKFFDGGCHCESVRFRLIGPLTRWRIIASKSPHLWKRCVGIAVLAGQSGDFALAVGQQCSTACMARGAPP